MPRKEICKQQGSYIAFNRQWFPICQTSQCNGMFNGGTNSVGITIQYVIWLKAHSPKWNTYQMLLKTPRIWKLIDWVNWTLLFRKAARKITASGILLTSYFNALCSHHQRSFPLQQIWEIQRLTDSNYAEDERPSNTWVSKGCLHQTCPLRVQESLQEEEIKREHENQRRWDYQGNKAVYRHQ